MCARDMYSGHNTRTIRSLARDQASNYRQKPPHTLCFIIDFYFIPTFHYAAFLTTVLVILAEVFFCRAKQGSEQPPTQGSPDGLLYIINFLK